MRHAAIAGLLTTLAAHAWAQQPSTPPAPSGVEGTFEVASIKPNRADSNRVNLNLEPGGRFVAKNADGTSKCGFRNYPGSAKGRTTMAILAQFFTGVVADHRPVENRTGLDGTFDFELQWTPDVPLPADAPPGPPIDPNGPSVFT